MDRIDNYAAPVLAQTHCKIQMGARKSRCFAAAEYFYKNRPF